MNRKKKSKEELITYHSDDMDENIEKLTINQNDEQSGGQFTEQTDK